MNSTQWFMFGDGVVVGWAFGAMIAAIFYVSGRQWQKRAKKAESSLRIAAYLKPESRLEWLISSADALPPIDTALADPSLERLAS
jgi:hypothetical protein